ncbi:hypothetical protein ACFWPV_09775 [Streptomyces uncialis]|uniref:hypothetical protein n=1 Tax=Streptomyces uncialis TaxID=1048205 RepID=UPI0036543E80
MPDPSTPRLGMYKSKSDGSELVTYSQDIGQNLDKLDAAAGLQIVTSTTRPSSPYPGKPIYESDTGRAFVSNGSAPASGSWVEIPTGGGTFGGPLAVASGSSVSIGSATLTRTGGGSLSANTNYLRSATAAGDVAYSAIVSGDTVDRVRIYADGKLEIGPGNAARDVTLYRDGANTLRTGDNLTVDLGLSVGGDLTVATTDWQTYTPTVGNQGSATWATRVGWYKKLGKIVFIEIYLAASGAGSGTTNLTLSLPSTPYRDGSGAATTRQVITAHIGNVTAGGNSSLGGTSSAIVLAGGSGPMVDQLRGPTDINMRGEQISTTFIATFQGWYREA